LKKTWTALAVAAAVGMGSLFGGIAVKTEAASISSLKKQKDQVHSQRTDINSSINETDQKISSIQDQQADVQTELKRIGYSIESTQKNINDTNVKMDAANTEIARLLDEVTVIQARIEKRNELLKDRARNYQETGGMVNYVAVLMGSQNFSDFVDRASAVAVIVEADNTILQQAEADKQELEQKQTQVINEKANLEKMKSNFQALNNQLSSQKSEQDQMLASLNEQEKQAESEKMDMQEEASLLAAQEQAIQKAIANEQAAQAAAAAAAAKNNSSSTAPSGGGSTVAAPPVTSGTFMKPTSGVLTSGFGPRKGGPHYGVDWAASGSGVPIVAAANGVVSKSYTSLSYGECVFITHYINGQVYTTVYAHMRTRLVQDDATVSKGQLIGYMGYTGQVDPKGPKGQHLHFELYKGQWTPKHSNAINPLSMVPR
jgi:peptidoglycan hydrolase CwlO-like protein